MAFDLVLKNGRVIDPSQGIDRITDVAFADGKVAAVGDDLAGNEARDVSGLLVTPGLIDLHTHVYWGGTSLGVDPDEFARASAVTTLVDTGSAGPGNFAGFRKHVIEPSHARILAYLHVSFAGIFAFSKTIMVGESHDMRLMAARDAAEVADANRDVIVGIKVRIGRHRQRPVRHRAARRGAAGRRRDRPAGHVPHRRAAAELRGGRREAAAGRCPHPRYRPFPNSPVHGDGKRARPEVLAGPRSAASSSTSATARARSRGRRRGR